MFHSIRSKLIISLLSVSLFVGAVSVFSGVHLLKKHLIGEATNRVRQDLNVAAEMYRSRVKCIRLSLSLTSSGSGFIDAVAERDISDLTYRLNRLSRRAALDFAGVATHDGRLLCRLGTAVPNREHARLENPVGILALERQTAVAGSVVLAQDMLRQEAPQLAARARIPLSDDAQGRRAPAGIEPRGLAMAAAVPIFRGNSVIAVLYGGNLLNRGEALVDTVRNTVFQGELYQDRNIGTAAIFLEQIRIATNALTPLGKRAIGTQVAPEIETAVLENGQRWVGRDYVLSDWYIIAYEPIEDVAGRRIGILSVGVLEKKYADIQKQALTFFVPITVAGMALAAGFGFVLANRIMDPVNRLINASRQVSEGSLQPEIGPILKGEFGVLQNTFQEMVAAVGQRRALSESKIIQSEKQASVGRLAAGVAHEINNPLTGVLTYTHLLLKRDDLNPEVRADLETVVAATRRVRKIVRGLLDYSRQTVLSPEPTDINQLVRKTVTLLENQALVKGVAVKFMPGENLPQVTLDRSRIQSVLMNLIINALDATPQWGAIKIFTAVGLAGNGTNRKGIEITVADTGAGIPPDLMDKLFDPFFTTKAVGQGTGLGLAVTKGIIRRHGGQIRVQSELGRGTRFFIWLPFDGTVKRT